MEKLTIIQLNDTHGSLELHDELFWKGDHETLIKTGGFARIAKYVKDLKRQKKNILFLDGGDLFHGTLPLVTTKGEALLPVLREMPLDAWVPGNWDFAYGKEQLAELAHSVPFPAIACNVKEKQTDQPFLDPYLIKDLQGLNVGIIGLTYPYVDETMPDSFSEGLAFSKGVGEIRRHVSELKGKVDLIVVLSHMGLPLDVELAGMVEGIDIILSGHSHDRIGEPIKKNGALIVQAGSNSSFLGKMEIIMDRGKLVDFQYELVTVDESFPEDEVVALKIDQVLDEYKKERNNVVGNTATVLHRMTLNEAPMDKLITDAYLHVFDDCDLAFSHGWRYGTPISQGTITEYDLYTIIPTNPEMFTLQMSGADLVKILEKNLEMVFSRDPFNQKGGYILRSSGLFMAFKPYNPAGSRIQTLQIRGKEIDPAKLYKVAGGGEQLFKKHEAEKKYHGIKAIEVIKQYLHENGTVTIANQDKILSI